MSDDGYAEDAFSPYSDFEDLLYDADPGPDLADDLASHAVHSPVFADEPGYELLEPHSDWEYYSDDYYDDDPAILQGNPQDGSPSKKRNPVKRGKKRKLADIDDIPELDLGERVKLRDCIKGTVWAQPLVQKDNTFKAGAGEKVALLQDWKKRFRTIPAQKAGKFKRRPLQRDESWANDMSLADMGLLTERGSRIEQSGETNGALKNDQDEEREEDSVVGDGYDGAQELLAEAAEVFLDGAELANLEAEADLNAMSSRPQKRPRRTKDLLPSPPTSTESTAVDGEPLTDGKPSSGSRHGRGRLRKPQDSTAIGEAQEGPKDPSNRPMAVQPKGTKRKASASPPASQEIGDTLSTAKGRGKRTAPVTNDSGESKNVSAHNTAASTRSTRSKKSSS